MKYSHVMTINFSSLPNKVVANLCSATCVFYMASLVRMNNRDQLWLHCKDG